MLVKRPISAIENLLSEHKFVRVHRSFIVSLSKVSGYNALSVQLGQKEIPIGRLYKQSILERLRGH
jgi:DNA-binding LytR/AlgR family response regulator